MKLYVALELSNSKWKLAFSTGENVRLMNIEARDPIAFQRVLKATCEKWKVPLIITSLGAKEDLNTAVHGWGGITMHDIINDRFARKAIEKGADGLIAVAAGAGGHAGALSPFALIQEIREWFDGPLALSGAIAHGRSILAAQAMGADLAYIGSAFIATDEARAQETYKQAIVDGRA